MRNLAKLQKLLDYTFNDISLLNLALTHKSYNKKNNERMEFVGDGILDHVIAVNLYNRYPHFAEGHLAKVRAALVSQGTLCEIATKLELGQHLLLGEGEKKSGGRNRPSILADALEAVFAAVAFDSSFIQVTRVIERLFAEYLDDAENLIYKDYKSILQEYVQGRKMNLPTYELCKTEGPDHSMIFHVECIIPELQIKVVAQGRNKKEASLLAAQKALDQINSNPINLQSAIA
ncbi:MAG: ribonuclease [Burkholderiales bacterium]|nr:ribonuclease [Burkholderiales bacterium]